jgi:hypothetical protein
MDLGDFATLRTHTRTLSHIAMFAPISMAWTGRDQTIRLEASQVSRAVFPMLGVQAWLGRTFGPGDDASNDSVTFTAGRPFAPRRW